MTYTTQNLCNLYIGVVNMTIELDEEATKRFMEILENPKPMPKEAIDHFKKYQKKWEEKDQEETKNK